MTGLLLLVPFLFATSEVVKVDPLAYGLPKDAVVVEARRLPAPARADRAVILWMIAPVRNPRPGPDEPYTCPEESRGSYFSGPARASLLDTERLAVINTVAIQDVHFPKKDTFDLPYRIHRRFFYLVEQADDHGEGQPTLLAFQDINGDGRPFEFVLYDSVSCMGLQTTLLGYSERQDRLIQFPVDLECSAKGTTVHETDMWVDYLFSERADRSGHWHYEIDYRGRGGCIDIYDVSYHRESERFSGTLRSVDCGPE